MKGFSNLVNIIGAHISLVVNRGNLSMIAIQLKPSHLLTIFKRAPPQSTKFESKGSNQQSQ